MKATFRKILSVGAIALGIAGIAPNAAAVVTLPDPNCGPSVGNNCLTFGDFSVYSLALLNFAATGDAANPGPGDPFYVKSSPGELGVDGYIVYGTGTNNNGVVTNVAGMDNSFSTPTGGIASFDTLNSGQEPLPDGFAGDQVNYWNSTTAAIRSVVGPGGQFVVYFNLNETGNDNLAGIDLLTWGQAVLCQAGGVNCLTFTLTGNSPGGVVDTTAPDETASGPASALYDPNVGDPNDPRWVYVHGTICARQNGGVPEFLHFGPCTAFEKTAAGGNYFDLNQNLGANQAAFAIYNQALSDLIMDPNSGYTEFSLRYIFGQENNGYEQLFSQATNVIQRCPLNDPTCFPPLPEPGSIALTGLALLSLLAVRRRRVKN